MNKLICTLVLWLIKLSLAPEPALHDSLRTDAPTQQASVGVTRETQSLLIRSWCCLDALDDRQSVYCRKTAENGIWKTCEINSSGLHHINIFFCCKNQCSWVDINDCNDVILINLIALEVDIAFTKLKTQKSDCTFISLNVYSLFSWESVPKCR